MAAINDLKFFACQDFSDLAASVVRPGANGVHTKICLPMPKGFSGLLQPFIGKSDVVVRVGVGWSDAQGGRVCVDGLFEPPSFIENIAQIEIRQRILWIDFYGTTVVLFRPDKILVIIVNGS